MAIISDEYFKLAKSSCNGNYINQDPSGAECRYALHLLDENNNYLDSTVWANDQTVQKALYIRNGTIQEWKRCNKSLSGYEHNVGNVIQYHQMLNQKGFQSLVYSGDHDMLVPYIATLKWIRSLNLTLKDKWRPWTVDGQVAGYTEIYKNGEAYITFATVKGAGHTAPEYIPKQCLAMIKRWLSLFPL